MNREGIKEFLREIAGSAVATQNRGKWVAAHCPLSKWRHDNGTDSNMSFGIKVSESGTSIYNCLACGAKGPLDRLLTTLERYTGEDYSSLKSQVGDNEFLAAALPTWDNRVAVEDTLSDPLDEELLDVYEEAVGHPYLTERGILDTTAQDLRLQVDPDNNGVERLLFPVYSPDGIFYGFTGRSITPVDADPRIRDYFGLQKRLLLLGADIVEFSTHEFVILTEGLFDFARMYQMGYNAVANMGSKLSRQQAAILAQWGKPVIIMYDNDRAGRKGRAQATKMLSPHVPCLKVRYPEGITDPGDVGLSKEDVEHMIDEARLL